MKGLMFLIAIFCCSLASYSQSLSREKCKSAQVELHEYNGNLPEGTVVVNSPAYLFDRDVKGIDELTKKEIRKIKKWARKFKSCTVYVDVNDLFLDRSINPGITDEHLCCLVTLNNK